MNLKKVFICLFAFSVVLLTSCDSPSRTDYSISENTGIILDSDDLNDKYRFDLYIDIESEMATISDYYSFVNEDSDDAYKEKIEYRGATRKYTFIYNDTVNQPYHDQKMHKYLTTDVPPDKLLISSDQKSFEFYSNLSFPSSQDIGTARRSEIAKEIAKKYINVDDYIATEEKPISIFDDGRICYYEFLFTKYSADIKCNEYLEIHLLGDGAILYMRLNYADKFTEESGNLFADNLSAINESAERLVISALKDIDYGELEFHKPEITRFKGEIALLIRFDFCDCEDPYYFCYYTGCVIVRPKL